MTLNICTKFHDNILDGIKVIERTRFSTKKSKGHNSIKCRWSYVFFFSAHHLIMVFICTKFHEIFLDGIKVKEWTRFSTKKSQRGIIP